MVNKKTKQVKRSIKFNLGVFALIIGFSLLIGGAFFLAYPSLHNHSRFERIKQIYANLKLDDSYRIAASNMFGEKRVYDSDKSRTASSSVEYGHNDTVSSTFKDLKRKIEASGFTFVTQEYSGIAKQYHFKSDKGEYIRVSVTPSTWQNAIIYGTPDDTSKLDQDAAPVYVTIKVNLDDNNE